MTHPLRRALTRAAAPSAPRRAYLRALSSSALVAPFMLAPGLATAQTLPSGGKVVAGSATVGAPAGGKLKIDQSSSRAIIDWTDFSVGKGGAVTFNNGNGATLNRVTGRNISSLDGLISATGSVYLLNPNGVVIGKNGVVDVGGSFVASTLNLSNDAFMAGGDLALAGNSAAPVINLGRIGALGGDVVLAAMTVENKGKISSPTGTTGLLAGSSIVLSDQADDNGRFKVLVGGGGSSATNAGQIAAAAVELRANGGSIYALAGDTRGIINATGVTTKDGRVFLTAGTGGRIEVADSDISARAANGGGGTIIVGSADTGETRIGAATILDASATNGAGGFVETSAAKIQIADDARVKTRGANGGANGTWLIDPTDFVVAKNGGSITGAALSANLAANDVVIASSGAGVGGNGDVIFQDDVSWSSDHTLTVNSFRDILIRSQITATGGNAGLVFNPGLGGGGSYKFQGGRITLSGQNASFQVGSTSYTLIRDLAGLRAMSSTGAYVLAVDINANASMDGGAGFNPIANFSGTLEGFGHAIDGLFINRGATDYVGLFGQIASGGVVQNLGLSNAYVVGRNYTGALTGRNDGKISNVYVTGAVNGAAQVGGLVGLTSGAIDRSFSSAVVQGGQNVGGIAGQASGPGAILDNLYASGMVVASSGNAGGLVGRADGGSRVENAYATGMVAGATSAGGLIGELDGSVGGVTVSKTYAAGLVTGGNVGGLVGASTSANVSYSYWDSGSGGQTQGWGSRTGATPWSNSFNIAQNNAYTQTAYGGFDFAATWFVVEGRTRPFLRSEWSTTIVNSHQLQLMTLNLSADYILAADIDLTETGWTSPSNYTSGMWASNGFVAIGRTDSGADLFTGSLDGRGYAISAIYQNNGSQKAGLIAHLSSSGSVRNLSLLGGRVFGTNEVGSLVGYNAGIIENVTTTVEVEGYNKVGGLVGANIGTVRVGTATGTVSGQTEVGGLIGTSSGTVTDSTAAASLTVTGDATHVGGLIGSTTSGMVRNSTASGDVSGTNYIGGLIGRASGGTSISNSHATGNVTGSGSLGGLVGVLWQGQVASSSATGKVIGASDDVGGLIGLAYESQLTDVWVNSGSETTGRTRVGGLVGWMAGGGSIVENSYAHSTITGRTAYGGLIGQNDGAVRTSYATGSIGRLLTTSPDDTGTGGLVGVNSVSGSIRDSYATGAVDGRNFVGGLVGTNRGTIAGSHASGRVTVGQQDASATTPTPVAGGQGGGLVGTNLGIIRDSYAVGDVVSTKGGFRMGGLVGTNEQGALIENSYAVGNVSSTKDGNLSGYQMGGLVGYQTNGSRIRGSYATGTVSGIDAIGGLVGANTDAAGLSSLIENSYATGLVSGNTAIGGLVGLNNGSEIRQSFATGDATGSSSHVGGLVGRNITSAFNVGLVTQSYSSGKVTGNSSVGGLVGNNTGRIRDTYATGAVTGIAGSTGGLVGANTGDIGYSYSVGAVGGPNANYIGGLVGSNDAPAGGTVVESYWDIVTSGRATSQGGTGKTTVEMLDPKTFRNWDIAAVWAPAGDGFRPELYGVSGVIGVYAGAFNRTYGEANTADLNANRTLVGAEYWNRLNGSIVGTFSTDTEQDSNAGLYYLIGSGGDTGMRVQGPNSGASARIVYAGTLNVAKRALTVTARGGSSVYGNSAINPDLDWVGLTSWDAEDADLLASLSNSFGITAFSAAGAYGLIVEGTFRSDNYDLTRIAGQWTVTPRTLRVTPRVASRVYGAENPEFSYMIGMADGEGLANGDRAEDVLAGALSTTATVRSNIGTYDIITGSLTASSNYMLAVDESIQLTVTPRTLRVTPRVASRVYGAENPEFSYMIGMADGEGLADGDRAEDVLSGALSTTATVRSNIGTYDIITGSLTASSNYMLAVDESIQLTVTPRTLRVTPRVASRVYGAENPEFSYMIGMADGEGLANGDRAEDVLAGALSTTATVRSNIGTYDIITGSLTASSNYMLAVDESIQLTVTPRTLRVTPRVASRVYGAENPEFSYMIGMADGEGLANGDRAEDVLSGALSTTATVRSNIGTYDIITGSLTASSNYMLAVDESIQLTVTPRTLRVTPRVASRVYGAENPEFSYMIGMADGEGLANGDRAEDVLAGALSTTATVRSNIGTYDIITGSLTASSNYMLAVDESIQLTVTPRTLRVTPRVASRVYGAENPEFSYMIGMADGEGLADGDRAEDVLSGALSTTATVRSNIGTYDIITGSLTASSNYMLAVDESIQLTVTPRTLRVTPRVASRVYGAENPEFSYMIGMADGEGLADGDRAEDVLSGALSTTATVRSNIGTYDIITGSLTASSNYMLAVDESIQLTVTPRTLRVTPRVASRVYGAENPEFSYMIGMADGEGLANGDRAEDVLSGALSTTATVRSNIGTYDIITGSLTASSNYMLAVDESIQLTVTPRTLRVTPRVASRVYGAENPEFSYMIGMADGEGLANGDRAEDVLSGALSTTATVRSNIGTYDIITGSLTASSNYMLAVDESIQLTVTPRTLRVTPRVASRVYGAENPEFSYMIGMADGEGLADGDRAEDVLSGALSTTATVRSNIGTYDIITGSLTASSNYMLAVDESIQLTVTPRTLRVTPRVASRVYGAENPEFSYMIGMADGEGLANGDRAEDVLAGALSTTATVRSNIGTYDIITGSLTASSNYMLAVDESIQLTVTPRTLRVTPRVASRVYGAENPEFSYMIGMADGEGLADGDRAEDVLSGALSTTATVRSNIGTYDIITGSLTASSNYMLAVDESIQLTVTPRTLRVTPRVASRVYGAENPEFSYMIGMADGEGLADGDRAEDVLSGALSTTATVRSNIGTYDIITGSLTASSNYMLAVDESIQLTVTPRTLRVTPRVASRVYGAENPEFSYMIGMADGEGLANGDRAEDVLSGALSTTATVRSNIGTYDIITGSLTASSNYMLAVDESIQLTVTPRTLRVTALGGRSIYGDTAVDPGLTWDGLTSWDADRASEILAGLSNSFGIGARTQVGPYVLSVLGNISDGNYQLETVDGRWVVDPRTVYVTARDLRRVYGDANPEALYDVAARVGSTGLLDGDRLIGSLLVDADVTDGVGFYNILLGDLRASSNNYVLDYTGAQLEITKRNVSVRANDLSRQYGDGNPALTWTAQGLVNGDTLSGSLATAADVTSGIGGYAIGLGSLGSSNYNIDFTGATLTVTPRELLVTANNLSRQYGDANPQLTWTADRLMNGDTLSGALATAASATSGIGNYDITVGTLAASPNYRLTFQGGQLTVTPRALIVTANNLSRIYGDANPALTWVAQGLVNGDTLSGALATVAGVTSNVGGYAITRGTLAASANYAMTYRDGTLQVTPRALLVQANNQSRQIGEPNPALTWVAQGLVNGDTLSGALATNANAGSLPGGYAITRGSLSASSNYALAFTNGVLTVRPPASGAGDGDPFPDPSPTPLEAPDPALLERNLKTLESDKPNAGIRIASSCSLQDDCLLVYPTNANAVHDVRLAAR